MTNANGQTEMSFLDQNKVWLPSLKLVFLCGKAWCSGVRAEGTRRYLCSFKKIFFGIYLNVPGLSCSIRDLFLFFVFFLLIAA